MEIKKQKTQDQGVKWSNTWNKYPDRKEALGGNIHIGKGLPRGLVVGLDRGNRSGTEDEANKNMKTITDPRRSNDLSKGNTETCYMASAEEHWHLINPVKVVFRANVARERINVHAVTFHYRKLIGSIQNWKMKKWPRKHYSLENPELGSSPSPSHLGEPAGRVQPLKEADPDPGSITFGSVGSGPSQTPSTSGLTYSRHRPPSRLCSEDSIKQQECQKLSI